MPNLSNPVTFLFASDGSLASEGLSVFLQTKSNFLMISECSDGSSAIGDIAAHMPEIAVIDAQLPDMNASQVIEAVRTSNRTTKIIVLGATSDRNTADKLLGMGADAYVVRSGPSRHLNDAIRYVRDGGKYLAPQLTKGLPVASSCSPPESHCEAVSGLREAVETQARTVERLEGAMERARCAIESLQQKVDQLSAAPLEIPPSLQSADETGISRLKPGLRAKVGAVAAALVIGVMGFMVSGVLIPAGPSSLTPTLHMSDWRTDPIIQASTLFRDQQYAAAELACRTILKRDPSNVDALRILASTLFRQNRVDEAADVVGSLSRLNVR
jgi:DNA-binding NarL/FixJ family response regulator